MTVLELTPETKRKYKFDSRFLDDMLRVSWDTAFTYAAKAMIIIATRYSGEAGRGVFVSRGMPRNDRDDEGRWRSALSIVPECRSRHYR